MAFHDILLALVSYPDATPGPAIDRAVRVARRLGGEVTALGVQIRVEAPKNMLAEALLGLESLAAGERAKSAASLREALDRFSNDARAVGLTAFQEIQASHLYDEAHVVVGHARTRDMTIVPVGPAPASSQPIAEHLLFDSGRPVVVTPETGPLDAETGPYRTVAIAWDGSRPAARAVGDALPLLKQARDVRVLSVINEKPSVTAGCGHDLVRHLAAHGITATVDEVDDAGRDIAEAFQAYAADKGVEFLVMGGFARSRVREVILGGATAGVLAKPFIPTLMAH
ncbi:universal stress protein [Phenylobacterium soli]|nr:universal stress protein [Phenylobacterium soli]